MSDLLARADKFLTPCGSCDLGMPMDCTCPAADYRPIMAELYNEVAALRALIDTMPHTTQQLYDWLHEHGINLGAGPGVLLTAMRNDLRRRAGLGEETDHDV